MIKLTINDNIFYVQTGISVIEACEFVGINVPRFCYHQNLSVAGNCRICLVEIANSPKPVASCALPAVNNMKIFIDTPLVKKARENVLEMLLLNHPLDCPICDQGGECDLQDQSKTFGLESSRFFFNKRVVENKECGPIIRTIMTRCIHCTRCVRFNSEVSGGDFFGTLNRGTTTEIGPYKASTYKSEISANVIDLCPVGALTSNFYSFKARPWEAISIESIDLTDGLGSRLYVNTKKTKIIRVFSKSSKQINGGFISDRARFSFDNIDHNRLLGDKKEKPSRVKIKEYWYNIMAPWIGPDNKVIKEKVLFLGNPNMDSDSLNFFKNLEFLGSRDIVTNAGIFATPVPRLNFFINWINSPVPEIDSSDKVCIVLSSNPRVETPLVNSKIFAKNNSNNYSVFSFSLFARISRKARFSNVDISSTFKIFESKYTNVSKLLSAAARPLIVFNETLTRRGIDSSALGSIIKSVNPKTILIRSSYMPNDSAHDFFNMKRISAKSLKAKGYENVVAINLDDSSMLRKALKKIKKKKVTWLNTHKSDIINCLRRVYTFSCKTEYEEENSYINVEERVQKTHKSVSPLKRAISPRSLLKTFLTFYTTTVQAEQIGYVEHMNMFVEMLKTPNLLDKISKASFYNITFMNNILNKTPIAPTYIISKYPTKIFCEDPYLISRTLWNSESMQASSQNLRRGANTFAYWGNE